MTPEELYNNPLHKHAFTELFRLMRTRAIVTLSYAFDGSGDSGNLESNADWEGLHKGSIELKNIPCDVTLKEPNGKTLNDNGKWEQDYETVRCKTVEELGYRLAFIVLNNDPHNWYNNDGGYGLILFEVTLEGKNRILCDMNVNERISHPCPSEIEFDHV